MALPVRLFHFRRLLNSVSLPFLIKLLFELHTTRDRRRTIFFGVMVIFILNCFRQNMLAFYYMSSGQFEAYKLINRYAHAFYKTFLGRNSVLILAGMSLLSYCLPMIHYCIFRYFRHFEPEAAELARFTGSLLEQRFTFIDRLFTQLPVENVNAVYRKLIAVMSHRLRQFDRVRLIAIFGRFEKLWFVSFGGILALMVLIYFLSVEIIYTGTGSEITGEFLLVIATILSYLVVAALVGVLPFLFVSMLFMLIFTNQALWKHFCADFRSLNSYFYSGRILSSIMIYKKIHYGFRVWIEMFTGLIKFNRYIVCEIFAVAIGLTLMANTILLVELLIVSFEWRIRLVLTTIFAVQFMICTFWVLILLRLRQQLYSLSPLIRQHVVWQSFSGYFRSRSLWKTHLNMEILCPHRKWAFNLGHLGKITTHNILFKCPALYTALILFILPVVKRENISLH